MAESSSERSADRGYAWVILGCGYISNMVCGVLYYSTGVVNTAVLDQMQEGVVKTSWVGSTLLGTLTLTGPVTGGITKAIGCRKTTVFGGLCILVGLTAAYFSRNVDSLIVSYGICVGFGIGCITTAASVAVGYYFEKLRPLAAGILVSGAGLGMLAGAPLVRFLFDTYGLNGMFLLLGALGSHACVGGMLMRPPKHEATGGDVSAQNNRERGEESKPFTKLRNLLREFCDLFSRYGFMLYVSSYALWSFGESAFQVHLPNYAESKGTSPQNAAMLFTAMGISSTIARILTGLAGNNPDIGTLLLHTGMLGLAGVNIMLIPVFSSSFKLQIIVCALYGLYGGGPMALLNPILVDLVGVKRLAAGYGLNNMFAGVGLFLGPPFAGLVLEATGRYDLCYFLAGAFLVLGSALSIAIPVFKKRTGLPINLSTSDDQDDCVDSDDKSENDHHLLSEQKSNGTNEDSNAELSNRLLAGAEQYKDGDDKGC
ncbi:monocarboxylate transporter 13-like isoform X2 [Haliotis rufescens]|uniref:monocarboxylate transporter 13-like isoform X2 n=1 Tax=Haliotis rufescens TaxID=6454 RepID=UPI00201EEBEA|nr:monocarboxylate transporter 13-like isoform X2 [Haliotis rufescens]